MHKSKLLQLIQNLNPSEFKELRKVVHSPIYTTNPQMAKFYEYLKPSYPAFEGSRLEKQKVFARLFPERDYSDGQMRVLMRELTKVVEEYMVLLQLRKNAFQKQKILSLAFGERGMKGLFEKSTAKLLNTLEAASYRDPEYQLEVFQLNYQKLNLLDVFDKAAKPKQTALLLQPLSHFYRQTELILRCQLLNLASIYNSPEVAEPMAEKELLVEKIYRSIYKLYTEADDSIYKDLEAVFFEQLAFIRPAMAQEIFAFLSNFLIRNMARNDHYYNSLLFQLYRKGLSNNVMLKQNRVADHQFLNILIVAAKENQFEWADGFIVKYGEQLSAHSKADALRLGRSYLLFYQRQFDRAVELLKDHPFDHPLYQLNAQSQILKCYFESFLSNPTYYEMILAYSLAFEKQLRRQDFLSLEKADRYLHFNQMIRKMAKVKMEKKRDGQKKLERELQSTKAMHSVGWIIAKIKAL